MKDLKANPLPREGQLVTVKLMLGQGACWPSIASQKAACDPQAAEPPCVYICYFLHTPCHLPVGVCRTPGLAGLQAPDLSGCYIKACSIVVQLRVVTSLQRSRLLTRVCGLVSMPANATSAHYKPSSSCQGISKRSCQPDCRGNCSSGESHVSK